MQCKFFSGHIDDKDVFILVSQLFYTSNFPTLLEFVICMSLCKCLFPSISMRHYVLVCELVCTNAKRYNEPNLEMSLQSYNKTNLHIHNDTHKKSKNLSNN